MGKVINMVGGGSGSGGGTVTITDTLDTHGGTIRTITTDPAATIIEALNITQNGTYTPSSGHAYGPVVAAVAGGGGLAYETGTYTPSADTAQPTISFANAHTTVPFFVAISETDTSNNSNSSAQFWSFYEAYQITGGFYYASTSITQAYGEVFRRQISSNGSVTTGSSVLEYPSTNSGNSNYSYARYWATETAFYPNRSLNSIYFIAGHNYKWIAVWK